MIGLNSELLGNRLNSLAEAHQSVHEKILSRSLDDASLIGVLARKAYRDEWLYAPAAELYPERSWSELD